MYNKESPASIAALFDSIAPHYDKTNSYMSLNLCRYWNSALIRHIGLLKPKSFGDLCGGTGTITFSLEKRSLLEKGIIIDFSHGMLEIAQKRLKQLGIDHIETLQADITSVPLSDGIFDVAAIAYGIRNVAERKEALQEAYRLIQPKGSIAILELTRPKNRVLRWMHSCYLRTCIPLIGALSVKNRAAYTYLSSSIHTFIDPVQLCQELKKAGFDTIQARPLFFGCATLFTARRP